MQLFVGFAINTPILNKKSKLWKQSLENDLLKQVLEKIEDNDHITGKY